MTTAPVCAQAVMIGDSLAADVQGAQNAGLAASVWVNRGGQARPPQACTLMARRLRVPGSGVVLSSRARLYFCRLERSSENVQ